MIKAHELRKGNILSFGINPDPKENIFVTVETIGKDGINHKATYDEDFPDADPFIDFYSYEDLNPIPLTPELLERFGFVKGFDGLWSPKAGFSIKEIDAAVEGFILIGYSGKSTYIKYLHQLQNLYFALTGEELQIKDL